jgi:hypothetical protein
VQKNQDQRPQHDQQQSRIAERAAGDFHRAGKAGRARPEQVHGPQAQSAKSLISSSSAKVASSCSSSGAL